MDYNIKIKKLLFLLVFTLAACSGKEQNGAENVIANAIEPDTFLADNSITADNEMMSDNLLDTMYVSARNGLRVRDRPGLSGHIVDVLEYKNAVTIVDRENEQVTIDGITDYWYLIQKDDVNGWVFGGYLYETLDAIEKKELIGKYYPSKIEIIIDNNSRSNGWLALLDESLNGNDNIAIEITNDDNGRLFIEYDLTMNYKAKKNLNQVWLRYPLWRDDYFDSALGDYEPFYSTDGEIGGGGTYIYFYFIQETIYVEVNHHMNWNYPYYEEPLSEPEEFQCVITFEKR